MKLMVNLNGNADKVDGDKRPDFKGNLKVEDARFIKNLADQFEKSGGAWVSVGAWKKISKRDGAVYVFCVLEDNEWQKNGNAPAPAPAAEDDVPF